MCRALYFGHVHAAADTVTFVLLGSDAPVVRALHH